MSSMWGNRIACEWATGIGPEYRFFGPESSAVATLRAGEGYRSTLRSYAIQMLTHHDGVNQTVIDVPVSSSSKRA
jgi:hypothetical protein